ncbi:hypothetical protein GUJ93_ZPchr0013g37159 [Zizania palustris]|uniref:Uncharacterized protein n=1 Tax=Zizania palustris TaxID=103762 RepID=A0A8J6BXX2_ZIZPA|nr:hypothetical protein GUJ93_ZPchr0013g37159 [Zizania palustris]
MLTNRSSLLASYKRNKKVLTFVNVFILFKTASITFDRKSSVPIRKPSKRTGPAPWRTCHPRWMWPPRHAGSDHPMPGGRARGVCDARSSELDGLDCGPNGANVHAAPGTSTVSCTTHAAVVRTAPGAYRCFVPPVDTARREGRGRGRGAREF